MQQLRLLALLCTLIYLLCLASVTMAVPIGLSQNPFAGRVGDSPLVEVDYGANRDKFLRSFCRYCHSQPFFCGELLELCYARFRL